MTSCGLLSLDEFRRFRDEYALEQYARRLPELEAARTRWQDYIDRINAAIKTERRRGKPDKSRLEHLMDKQREAYRMIAPIDGQIQNIRQDIPIRQARLEAMNVSINIT